MVALNEKVVDRISLGPLTLIRLSQSFFLPSKLIKHCLLSNIQLPLHFTPNISPKPQTH